MNQKTTKEQILEPLRELYRKDINHRKIIAEYAKSFKKNDVFIRKQADFMEFGFFLVGISRRNNPTQKITIHILRHTIRESPPTTNQRGFSHRKYF